LPKRHHALPHCSSNCNTANNLHCASVLADHQHEYCQNPAERELAEAVRFELTNGCPLPVFKTGAIDHSATLPAYFYVSLSLSSHLENADNAAILPG